MIIMFGLIKKLINKKGAVSYKKLIVGFLALAISASVVYVTLSDNVRIRVDEDKSTFYVRNENNRWVVSGREYLSLFDGASKMNRNLSGIQIDTIVNENNVAIIKMTPYIRGPMIVETYLFDGSISDVELFPVSHEVEVINGKGYFLRYEVKDLVYNGITYKLSGETVLSFGRKMKVELNPNYRWAWVYASGTVRAQYDIPSNVETYNFRLFDPDSSPTIILNFPSNNSIYNTNEFDFGFTPTDDIGFSNATLWINVSGVWSANKTNSSVLINDSINIISISDLPDGNYIWNINITDSGSNSSFAASNFTLTINTIGYLPSIEYPYWISSFQKNDSNAQDGNYTPLGQTSIVPIFNISSNATDPNDYEINVSLNNVLLGCQEIWFYNESEPLNVSYWWNITTTTRVIEDNISSGQWTPIYSWIRYQNCTRGDYIEKELWFDYRIL